MKFLTPQLAYLLHQQEARRNLNALLKYLAFLAATILAYSVLFHAMMLYEGQYHSWLTGFYWTLTVMSTLGFGDITFHSDLGRAFSVVVLLSGIVLLLIELAKSAGFPNQHGFFWGAVAGLGLLQLMAAILNLLPIPGLDGYGILEPYLDPKFRAGAEQFKPFGLLAVFALLQVGQLNRVFFGAIYWLFDLSGLSHQYGEAGITLLRFWQVR